jgi:hypothetical protein
LIKEIRVPLAAAPTSGFGLPMNAKLNIRSPHPPGSQDEAQSLRGTVNFRMQAIDFPGILLPSSIG